MIDLYLLTGIVNAVTALSLGMFVYLKGRKPLHRYWFLMSLCVAVWALLVGIERIVIDQAFNLTLNRIEAAFAVCIPVLFLHVALYLAYGDLPRQQLVRLKIAYAATLGLLALTPTSLFLKALAIQVLFDGKPYDAAGLLYFLFPLLYVTLVSYALITVLKVREKTEDPVRKAQLTLFSLGTTIGFLAGGTCFPLVFNIQSPPFGFHLVWLHTLVLTYAIFRHHLWDIQLIIRRGILSAIIVAMLVASYFGLIYAIDHLSHATLLQHHILALSLTALTTFGLGLLVFLASPKKRLNQIFGLYSLTIAWWGFSEAGMVGSHDLTTADLFSRMEWPSIIFVAATFLHTVYLLTQDRRKVSRVVLRVSYTLSLVLLVLYFAGFVARPLRSVGYSPYFNSVTPIGSLIPFLFVVIVNTGLGQLWHVYRSTTGQHRVQLKYLFWGSLAGYLGAMPDWLFVFGFYIRGLSPFGIYAVPLYSIATTYAVLHHKLFDVHLVIRKSLIYSVLVGLLTIGYFALIYILERLYQQTFGYHSVGFSLAAFALMALIFQPLKFGVQRAVDWLFFRAPHEELVKRMERLEQEVREADKLRAVATLAAGMAHEIKNPLTSLKTFAEYLPEKGNDPNFQRQFQRIVTQEVKKIDLIVRRVLDFAKPVPRELQPIDVSRVLDETLEFLSNECLKRRVEVRRYYQSHAAIQANPQQLRQVFLNLVLNSLEAIDGVRGRLKVGTMQVDDQLVVTIEDTGKGIPKEYLTRIFDPFFTTKQNGTGLGLPIVRSIISDHHGAMTIESEVQQGTKCIITFPLSPSHQFASVSHG